MPELISKVNTVHIITVQSGPCPISTMIEFYYAFRMLAFQC